MLHFPCQARILANAFISCMNILQEGGEILKRALAFPGWTALALENNFHFQTVCSLECFYIRSGLYLGWLYGLRGLSLLLFLGANAGIIRIISPLKRSLARKIIGLLNSLIRTLQGLKHDNSKAVASSVKFILGHCSPIWRPKRPAALYLD